MGERYIDEKEEDEIELIQGRFVKMALGVARNTTDNL